MALTGNQKAYLQARSAIARSGASRSNYVFPLYGVVTVGGNDITRYIQYGTLRLTINLNEAPDTASFEVLLTDTYVDDAVQVSADVVIGLGGPTDNLLFGGRILTMQTTSGPAGTPPRRSALCVDYLQALDSEYLITYGWPAQSATTTIDDLIVRFATNKGGSLVISTAAVAPSLPSHAAFAVVNEKVSTVLRRLVTMFPAGGAFYVDPLKVLHVWAGASEPNVVNPQPLTLDNPTLKGFAETVEGSQIRDAILVEGRRTNAPIGTPGPDPTDPTGQYVAGIPVLDASILDRLTTDVAREVRIGSQRFMVHWAEGPWMAAPETPQTTVVTTDVAFNPDPGVEGNTVTIPIATPALLNGRHAPWIRIDQQYLRVTAENLATPFWVKVPRTGYGAMNGPIQAGAQITIIDSLSALFLTGRYDAPGSLEQVRAQPIDAEVVMTVRSTPGAGAVFEHLIQDGRFSRTGATNRGGQELTDFRAVLTSIEFETEDLNAKPGRLQAYTIASPPVPSMTGEYMILSSELTWPVWGQPPRRRCRAAKIFIADVVDTWLSDTR